jgi:DNA-binding LacI/PurR family transcriptional regulator
MRNVSPHVAEGLARDRVAVLLRDRILDGALRFGESLPSERQLSSELGVGRAIVRQALAELDKEGLLARRGTRQRTVAFDRGDDVPGWLRQSVIVLTLPRVTAGPGAVRDRWQRYTSLGIVDHLREADIPTLALGIGTVDEGELRRLAKGRPMGVLIPELNGRTDEVIRTASMFREAGIPVVCYGGSPELLGFDRVASDHAQGSADLTAGLLTRGRRRVVQCWPTPWDTHWFVGRQSGYGRAMRRAGLEPAATVEFPRLATPATTPAAFDYAVKQVAGFLLNTVGDRGVSRPDALLLSSDRDVPYAAAALRRLGLRPGADVLLAGYDNYWDCCEERAFEPLPPVLTVDKRNEQAGSEMVRLLLDRVAGRLADEPQTRVLPQKVVEPARAPS